MTKFTRDAAVELAARTRAVGKTVVFASGVFDLLHPGHVRYLQQARQFGDALIVGIKSDRSVGRNRGADRPVIPEAERADVLAALDCVDGAVIFDEDTPHIVVAVVEPDVLVQAADSAEAGDAGAFRDVVEGRSGRVVRISVEPGYSTTSILERIRSFLWS